MLEFYEFNTLNISIVLISTFIIYYILTNIISSNNNSKGDSKDKTNNEFSIEYLLISMICAICISLVVAYVMSGHDEALLTENYWENSNLE